MLLRDIPKINARLFTDRVALIDEIGNELTWNQFNTRVNSLSNALLGLGLRKGDRLAIICDNRHEFVEAFFAAIKIGVIPTAINYRFPFEHIAFLVNDCGAKTIFVENKYVQNVNYIRTKFKTIENFIGIDTDHGYSHCFETLIAGNKSNEPEVEIAEEDPSVLIYTSGTTGLPKGVLHSSRNMIHACLAELTLYHFYPDDRVIITPPLYVAGIILTIATLFSGATAIIFNFKGQNFMEMVEKHKATVVTSMIPTRFHIIREFLATSKKKYDVSTVRKMGVGPQYVSPEQLREMWEFFGRPELNKAYLGTEFIIASGLLWHDIVSGLCEKATEKEKKRLTSAGKGLVDNGIRIVDDNGQDLPPGKVGEILVSGSTTKDARYWNRPDLTQQKWRGGWCYTSDLGFFDENGYLYFAGRKDDLIRSGAFWVAPAHVESVLVGHPSVNECAVFGVPDKKWMEAVTAAISLREGRDVTEDEIKEHCRKYLAGYQVPKKIHIMEELPKDPGTRKILVREIKKLLGYG
jgi:long-chain acyl-CoA synthetase